jgi:glycosyltransferase involved in cell wall biosynthesis
VLLLSLKKGIGHTASPSKFIAYLFSAKPVIASIDHNSDVAMIINETRCGYTIPPDDKNALSAAMRNITTLSRSHLNTMGINGYNYAISNYSRENNLQKIIQIFEQNTK